MEWVASEEPSGHRYDALIFSGVIESDRTREYRVTRQGRRVHDQLRDDDVVPSELKTLQRSG